MLMAYHCHVPRPPLGDFIARIWHYDGYEPPHCKERILPSGTVELVINHVQDVVRIYHPTDPGECRRLSGALVSGPYGRPFVIDAEQQASMMGVHFRPGGAFLFLGFPLDELADTHIDLETVWGASALELRERLCAAGSPAERFRLIEEALLARISRPIRHHGTVTAALDLFERLGPDATVGDVARRVGVSHRRFIQVFAALVGLTPKLYCRVQRFQSCVAILRQSPLPDWARLAAERGFFDQSHLIRDFREFTGLNPTDFLRRQDEADSLREHGVPVSDNHVPIAERGQIFPIPPSLASREYPPAYRRGAWPRR